MGNRYRLVELGNSELLAGLSELVQQSNVLTAQVLAHLVELEERMLPLELGFSSLFAYCVEALGMSEGTAGRRVAAARVCRRFPEAFERVARAELHLCALCALAPHLNSENSAELFEACRGKTRRQIEALLAARFPRPDVREQIRRLPVRPQVATRATESIPLSSPAVGTTAPAMAAEMATIAPNPVALPIAATVSDARRRAREFEPLSVARFGVHFTADAELRELIERARALASHRLPNGDLASLMKLMAASFVRQEEKRRFGIGARSRRVKTSTDTNTSTSTDTDTDTDTKMEGHSIDRETPPGEVPASLSPIETTTHEIRTARADQRRRYVRVTVRRETYGRDAGRCAFVSPDGRRCTARAFLELDHVIPFARSGGSEAWNIRLLCRAHNRLHARNCFGAMHVMANIAASKRSDPATQAR